MGINILPCLFDSESATANNLQENENMGAIGKVCICLEIMPQVKREGLRLIHIDGANITCSKLEMVGG